MEGMKNGFDKGIPETIHHKNEPVYPPSVNIKELFADESSLQDWETTEYRGLPLLSVSMRAISILNPFSGACEIINRHGNHLKVQDVVKVSMSDGSYAILHKNGRVEADGDNDYGQINVKQLRNIVDICSINGCTLAVNNKGQVIVRGYTPFKDEIEKWKNIRTIWGNTSSITGVTNDGSVLAAVRKAENCSIETFDNDFLQGNAVSAVVYKPEPLRPMAVILMEDGDVCSIQLDGKENKAERTAGTRYKAIAAMKETVMFLSENGNVDSMGQKINEVNKWRNIMFLAANENCASGVDIKRNLYLTGQSYCKKALINDKKWFMTF